MYYLCGTNIQLMEDRTPYGGYKRGRFSNGSLNKKKVVQTISFSTDDALKAKIKEGAELFKLNYPKSTQSDFIRRAIEYYITHNQD